LSSSISCMAFARSCSALAKLSLVVASSDMLSISSPCSMSASLRVSLYRCTRSGIVCLVSS
jgi:hypothetical protein